jgi:hypothetical protein
MSGAPEKEIEPDDTIAVSGASRVTTVNWPSCVRRATTVPAAEPSSNITLPTFSWASGPAGRLNLKVPPGLIPIKLALTTLRGITTVFGV